MTTINGRDLFEAYPIKDMLGSKERCHGVSYGLTEAGYDIRLKQEILFGSSEDKRDWYARAKYIKDGVPCGYFNDGRFIIASAIEEFQMPNNLVGVVHDKSTWARRGLSVLNTVVEPGWKGFLTLELVYHGTEPLTIPAGAGIAQILFSEVSIPAAYTGKYQNQADEPVAAIHED